MTQRMPEEEGRIISIAALTIGLPIILSIALYKGFKGFGKAIYEYAVELREILFD